MKIWNTLGTGLTKEILDDASEIILNNHGKYYTPVILGMEHGITFRDEMTVEEWLRCAITEEDCREFPNAKKAQKIKNSKLYKLLE